MSSVLSLSLASQRHAWTTLYGSTASASVRKPTSQPPKHWKHHELKRSVGPELPSTKDKTIRHRRNTTKHTETPRKCEPGTAIRWPPSAAVLRPQPSRCVTTTPSWEGCLPRRVPGARGVRSCSLCEDSFGRTPQRVEEQRRKGPADTDTGHCMPQGAMARPLAGLPCRHPRMYIIRRNISTSDARLLLRRVPIHSLPPPLLNLPP